MSPVGPAPAEAARAGLPGWLDALGVEHEPGAREHEHVATLPGEHKLRTVVSLRVGEHHLRARAFVIRAPEENRERVYGALLRRNLRLPGLTYAVDGDGDVHLTAAVPLAGLDEDGLDRLLGAFLDVADGDFDELLVRGFRGSMQREWDWRVSRGESTRNLEAFRHLLERDAATDAPDEATRPRLRACSVTIGTPAPRDLARFYADLLGWRVTAEEEPPPQGPPESGWAQVAPPDGVTGPTLNLEWEEHFVRPVWPARAGEQNATQHLDVEVDDLQAATAWALTCGARLADDQPQEDVRVLLDPHGHPFCLF